MLFKRKKLITTILLLLIFSCYKKDELITNEGALILNHDGLEREYLLYVPDTYDGNSSYPILFNFHGFGGTATDQMFSSDMRPISDTAGFILVYPQGSVLSDGQPHWNIEVLGGNNKSNADDFGFIEALINKISSGYNIDTSRIYACGYSNGAGFSFSIACNTNKIAAIASVSGSMSDWAFENCNPSHPVGIIIFHGTADDIRPYNGLDEGLLSVDDALSFWTDFNNADSIPTFYNGINNGTIEHYIFSNGDNNSSVEHYKVLNGGHFWFDFNYEGSNADQLIWKFVSKHSIE